MSEAAAAPIKTDVRKAEELDQGDRVRIELVTSDPR
jgi:hypothetical protein